MTSMGPWRQSDRDGLEWAMGVLGHSQRECAEALHELGATGATQTSVSKWVSGKIAKPQSKTVAAVRAYIADAQAKVAQDAATAEADSDTFAEAVRGITSEPLLGPRQANFVDGLIERLRSGNPMTPEDEATSEALQRILGLTSS